MLFHNSPPLCHGLLFLLLVVSHSPSLSHIQPVAHPPNIKNFPNYPYNSPLLHLPSRPAHHPLSSCVVSFLSPTHPRAMQTSLTSKQTQSLCLLHLPLTMSRQQHHHQYLSFLQYVYRDMHMYPPPIIASLPTFKFSSFTNSLSGFSFVAIAAPPPPSLLLLSSQLCCCARFCILMAK